MASKTPPRIYLCSTEWFALLNGEEGSDLVKDLVNRAQKGAFQIVGSQMLRIEVHSEDGRELLNTAVKIWSSVDLRVAERATEIRTYLMNNSDRDFRRQTADIIHLATASIADVEAFITSDQWLRKTAEKFDVPAYDRGGYPVGEMLSM